MKFLAWLLLALSLMGGTVTTSAVAGATDPLFVNLTTDDPHRASMGITFGGNQHDRGHPLTVFLNDKGVLIGSTTNTEKFGAHQKALAELMKKGVVVLGCPMCMKHYGVKEADLLPGVKVGSPEVTGDALFKDNAKSLTW